MTQQISWMMISKLEMMKKAMKMKLNQTWLKEENIGHVKIDAILKLMTCITLLPDSAYKILQQAYFMDPLS